MACNTEVCFPHISGWFYRIYIYLVMLAHSCQIGLRTVPSDGYGRTFDG